MNTKQLKTLSMDSISDRRRSGKRTTLISPVSTITARWPTTTTTTATTATTTTTTTATKESESRQIEDDRKSGWTDVCNKKTTPTGGFGPFVNTDHDPFAGMKQCVDYQQEIERLKTLVPKVEAKKRPSSRPLSAGAWNESTSSPRPTGKSMSSKGTVSSRKSPTARPMSSLGLCSRTIDDNSVGPERVRSATAPHSPVSSKSSTPTISPTPSHSNISNGSVKAIEENSVARMVDSSVKKAQKTEADLEAEAEADSEATSTSTASSVSAPLQTEPKNPITEEEKARFLEFVRSWTGGWKGGWGEDESMKKTAGSLWAEQSPWDFTPDRQRANQPDPMANAQPLMDELYWHSSAAQIVLPMHKPVQRQQPFHNDLWRNNFSLHDNSAAAMRPYFHPKAQYQHPGYTT
ncbi:hypothetical protein CLU79DRAFT_307068 [Phycomyces nitens]|nr:hypothetical protein CLU79DRAFT_307068 [Phycomyces nitens]